MPLHSLEADSVPPSSIAYVVASRNRALGFAATRNLPRPQRDTAPSQEGCVGDTSFFIANAAIRPSRNMGARAGHLTLTRRKPLTPCAERAVLRQLSSFLGLYFFLTPLLFLTAFLFFLSLLGLFFPLILDALKLGPILRISKIVPHPAPSSQCCRPFIN